MVGNLCRILAVLIFAAFLLTPAVGQVPGQTDLAKAVPDDVFVFVHGVENPERESIDELWAPVFKAISEAEIHTDILETIQSMLSEEERKQFDDVITTATPLIQGVDWASLVEKEVVFANRMNIPNSQTMNAEYMAFFRCNEKTMDKTMAGFRAILETFASMVGGIPINEKTVHGAQVWELGGSETEGSISFALAKKGKILGMFLGDTIMEESLEMLAGESRRACFVDSETYKSSIKHLPKPEDMVFVFRLDAMLDPIIGFLNGIMPTDKDQNPDMAAGLGMALKILNVMNVIEGIASVETTDHDKIYAHEVTLFKPGVEKSLLGKLFKNRKPIENFDRFVPKEAKSFSMGASINFLELYSFLIDFVKTDVPDGAVMLEQWKMVQDQMNFHPELDVLAWLGDSYVSISLPPAVPSPMGGDDGVIFLKVKDAEIAANKIGQGIQFLETFLKQNNQMLMVSDVEIEGTKGFKSVTHPMMAAFIKPVIGVHADHLVIGTSKEAVGTCLAVARGDHASIKENKQFASEALMPTDKTYSFSFKDKSKLGQEIGGTIQGMSMGLSMVSAMAAQEEPELGQLLIGLGKILGKLGPIGHKIDFYRSTSSTTEEFKNYSLKQTVTNYRLSEKTGKDV